MVILSACSAVPTASEIPASIANATTAADHLRIADYFAQKAATYEAEAKLHEKMPYAYQGRPKFDFASMNAHCKELQNQLNAAAREAKALEQAHRDLAASIK
jgi:hypothetical protein